MDLVNWFWLVAFVAMGGWLVGLRMGDRSPAAARAGLLLGGAMLLLWTFLVRHPAVAVQAVPVWVMSKVEGVGAVPWFMLILGIAWSRSTLRRQQVVIGWALLLGTVFFVNGGMWLLQRTPTSVMGQSTDSRVVMQSQDYSCVPAASATMLNLLGVPTTEAQMAELTFTRPGTGSTTLRALEGIDERLEGTPYQAVLLEPAMDELADVPLPAITPLQFERSRRHMVTITQVTPHGIHVQDPVDGLLTLSWKVLEPIYAGQVIAVTSVGR